MGSHHHRHLSNLVGIVDPANDKLILFIFYYKKVVSDDLAILPNLNWLIHMAYARRDFNYCKDVIGYQFQVTYDHEYLYFVKVNSKKQS